MQDANLLFSQYANEEGFELRQYLVYLFECVSSLPKAEDVKAEPAP